MTVACFTSKGINVHAGARGVHIHDRFVRRDHVALRFSGLVVCVEHTSVVCVLHIERERLFFFWDNNKRLRNASGLFPVPLWCVAKHLSSTTVKHKKRQTKVSGRAIGVTKKVSK